MSRYEDREDFNWMGLWVILLITSVVVLGILTLVSIRADYKYEQKFSYAWNLADKSSTIEAKSKYIDEFVFNLQKHRDEFSNHNAMFLATPDNSFDNNLEAVVSLRDRLALIQKMDPSSFQYNTAIQQITAQEQGEAKKLLCVIEGCYYLANYPLLWCWIGFIITGLFMVVGVVSIFGIIDCQ